MFVLNPKHTSIFESQLKHVFYNQWLARFDCVTKCSSSSTIETRRSRFGIRGNRFLNIIASLYGYKSWSHLLVASNETSNDSHWISLHPLFSMPQEVIKQKALEAVKGRHKCTLKNPDEILADTLTATILTFTDLHNAPKELEPYPHLAIVDTLMKEQSLLGINFSVGIQTFRKDWVDPFFDVDGEIVTDATPYYSLVEDGVDVDTEVPIEVSPFFKSLSDAEEFFTKKFTLYCQYLINIEARTVDRTAQKVSDYASVIY